MKYLIQIIILVLVFSCNHSANRKNITDKNGLKQGIWETYENNILISMGDYKDGKKEGIWQYWYDNGQKMEEGNYRNGLKIGIWVKWYQDGELMWEGEYKEGKRIIKYDNDKIEIKFLDKEVKNDVLYPNTEYLVNIRVPNIPQENLVVEALGGTIQKLNDNGKFNLHVDNNEDLVIALGYYPDKDFMDFINLIEEIKFKIAIEK